MLSQNGLLATFEMRFRTKGRLVLFAPAYDSRWQDFCLQTVSNYAHVKRMLSCCMKWDDKTTCKGLELFLAKIVRINCQGVRWSRTYYSLGMLCWFYNAYIILHWIYNMLLQEETWSGFRFVVGIWSNNMIQVSKYGSI